MATETVLGISVSNVDKLLYPDDKISKGDVIAHYEAVAEAMLPHVAGRPLVLHRYPDGITKGGFVQQDAANLGDWAQLVETPRRQGSGTVSHVVATDAATLVHLANLSAVELHCWPSTVDDLEHPDRLVLDIDPPAGTEVATLRDVARMSRDLVSSVGLTPFVQATGGRGFHVVAPLDRGEDYEFVRDLAGDLADRLARKHPDLLTTAQRKEKRGERIFLDVGRNAYGQTFVAPYSPRARPGAPVATPLDWSELGRATPNGHDLKSIRNRLAHKDDPWTDLAKHAGSASDARTRLTAL